MPTIYGHFKHVSLVDARAHARIHANTNHLTAHLWLHS